MRHSKNQQPIVIKKMISTFPYKPKFHENIHLNTFEKRRRWNF